MDLPPVTFPPKFAMLHLDQASLKNRHKGGAVTLDGNSSLTTPPRKAVQWRLFRSGTTNEGSSADDGGCLSLAAEYYTPEYALEYIYKYVSKYKKVWEPCAGKGHIVKYLEKKGHVVVATDILMGQEYDIHGTYSPPSDQYDIIITNPPFKKKTLTLQRLFSIDKPFAILLPTMALDSGPVRALLKKHEGQFGILMPNKTINYILSCPVAKKKSRSFFHSSWFCWKIENLKGLVLL
jgi:hypothetical protein